MEAVEGPARVGDVVNPLRALRERTSREARARVGARTFSGCDTIIWQSMKMPGTPLDTQARMGAPIAYMRTVSRVKRGEDAPMVIFGTK